MVSERGGKGLDAEFTVVESGPQRAVLVVARQTR